MSIKQKAILQYKIVLILIRYRLISKNSNLFTLKFCYKGLTTVNSHNNDNKKGKNNINNINNKNNKMFNINYIMNKNNKQQ